MTTLPRKDFGFSIVTIRRGDEGALATVARFQCVECGATNDLRVQSGVPLNAEGYAKRATQAGWKADPWKKNRCYCPRCAGPLKSPNDPNSELKKVVPLSVQPVPRPISPEQKQRIRALLDKHFDDSAGCYLDEMSDQRVAESVDVPRIHVEQIREAAYGPIRITPELAALRADLTAMRAALDDERKRVDEMVKRLADLSARAEKMHAVKAA